MGGRGTYATGKDTKMTFKTVGYIENVKVLEGLNGSHGLPEESRSSNSYIQLYRDGTFKTMRIYGDDHYLRYEIAYHPEPNLNSGNTKERVLHIHEYRKKDDFNIRPARLLTDEEKKKYGKFLLGVEYDKW